MANAVVPSSTSSTFNSGSVRDHVRDWEAPLPKDFKRQFGFYKLNARNIAKYCRPLSGTVAK